MKTNKSFTKRLRVTRTGKILSRRPGIDHFNAKESRSHQLGKRKPMAILMKNKVRGRFLASQ